MLARVSINAKLIPHGMMQLFAVMNAYSVEIVRRSLNHFGRHLQSSLIGQITLHWIHFDNKALKQWVRNRLIKVRRFSNPYDGITFKVKT